MKTFIIIAIFTFFLSDIAKATPIECYVILCVYGAQQGRDGGAGCADPINIYNKIEKRKKKLFGSSKLDCPATIAKRIATLSACKENIYPLKKLVDCKKY